MTTTLSIRRPAPSLDRARFDARLQQIGIAPTAKTLNVDSVASQSTGGKAGWLKAAASSGSALVLDPPDLGKVRLSIAQSDVDRANGTVFKATEKLKAVSAALSGSGASDTIIEALTFADGALAEITASNALAFCDDTQFQALDKALSAFRALCADKAKTKTETDTSVPAPVNALLDRVGRQVARLTGASAPPMAGILAGELRSPYSEVDAALAMARGGDRDGAISLLKAHRGEVGAVGAYVIHASVTVGDPLLLPMLREYASDDSWVGGDAKKALETMASPQALAAFQAKEAAIVNMGNEYSYGEQAMKEWNAGHKDAASAMMRNLYMNSEGAPVSALTSLIVESGDKALIPTLDAIANHNPYWVGEEAARGIKTMNNPEALKEFQTKKAAERLSQSAKLSP